MNKTPSGFINWLRTFLFIDPTLSVLLVLILSAGGYLGYQTMIKEALPDLKIPMASISTFWHGGSQTVVEKEITDNIERELRDLDTIKRYSSGSMFSNSSITVEFNSDESLEESINQLRAKVDVAADKIPKQAKKPVVKAQSVRNMPIATYVFYGDLPEEVMAEAVKKLKKKILKIPGITKVRLFGHNKYQVRVQVFSERLRAYDIPPGEISSIIETHKQDYSLGIYEGREQPLNIKGENAINSIEQLQMLPVKRLRNGLLLRLKDVAHVEKVAFRATTETYFSRDGKKYEKGIALSLMKGSGKDTIKLVDQATNIVKEMSKARDWPAAMKHDILSNNAEVIQQELDKTIVSGWQSILGVFLVLFVLLTWREALVAALSIPITFLGVIIVLWWMGYTFNVMVIIGMVVALGLLVDDFILMMEGMHDGLYLKKLSFAEAASQTIKYFAIPSLAGTVTTILIFVPLANIGGTDGKFIQAIPATAAACLVVSYLVSIFISIPLSRYLLSRAPQQKTLWIDRVTVKFEGNLVDWLIKNVVSNRKDAAKCLGWSSLIVIIGFSLMPLLPMVMYPISDGRNMGITVELPIDYKLDETREIAKKLSKVLKNKEYLTSTLMVVGERDFIYEGSLEDRLSPSTRSNVVGFTSLYIPKKERDDIAIAYVPELRKELHSLLKDVPGYRLFITSETGGSSNEDPLQINISGPDMRELQKISQQLQIKLRDVKGLNRIRDTFGQGKVEATVKPRQEVLDLYGLTAQDFNSQLGLYLGNHKITEMRTDSSSDDLDIRYQMYWPGANSIGAPDHWQQWKSIRIRTPSSGWIPLELLADIELDQVPVSVIHKNGVRNVTIMASSFTMSFKDLQHAIEPILHDMKKQWPAEYDFRWAGAVEQAESTYGKSKIVFILAVLGVFSVLVLQFRSFIQPAIILTTVIFGIAGVFWGFALMAYELSFPAIIGMMALAGINVNDGIVLVDTMNRHHRAGMDVDKAAARGAADRFRPIVSTTLTTLVGLIPLAIADEAWRPLCAAIIFGEIVSTTAAMIVVPALFRIVTPNKTKTMNHY